LGLLWWLAGSSLRLLWRRWGLLWLLRIGQKRNSQADEDHENAFGLHSPVASVKTGALKVKER